MAFIECNRLLKGYGTGDSRQVILRDIELEIEEGEFVAIIGFSGTGKSTLLNMIAGLTLPDEGEVIMNGKPVTGPSPERGVVFQQYALLPWLTVLGNVMLAVDAGFPEMSKKERQAHAKRYIEMVSLTPAINKYPAELSGGMRQRVAVARALAMKPEVLLLDEPLSALDALTRSVLQDEILDIWENDRRTVVMITNDVDEGLIMADRIIPLRIGPGATLGPEFRITIDRPRDRRALNHDAQFIELRKEIVMFLMAERRRHGKATSGDTDRPLPALIARELDAAAS